MLRRAPLLCALLLRFGTSAGTFIVQNDTTEHFRQGIVNFKLGDYTTALHEFELELIENKSNVTALKFKAHCQLKLGLMDSSEVNYTTYINIAGGDIGSHLHRGEARQKLRKYREAINDYETVIKLGANDYLVYFNLGICYQAIWKYGKAVKVFDLCEKIEKGNPNLYYSRGLTFFSLQRYERALLDFNTAIKLGIESKYNIYCERGDVYLALKEIPKAKLDFQRHLKKNPNEINGLIGLGDCSYFNGDSSKGNIYYNKSKTISPRESHIFYRWGISEFRSNNTKRAIELLNRAKELGDSSTWLFHAMALTYGKMNDTTKMNYYFKKALLRDPENQQVYVSRIEYLFSNFKYSKQIEKDINYLIKLNEDPFILSQKYAIRGIFFASRGDYARSMADADTAVAIFPMDPYPYVMRAIIRDKSKGPTSETISDLSKAINLDKLHWQAYLLRASAYCELRDFVSSCRDAKKARSLGGRISKTQLNYCCNGIKINGKAPTMDLRIDPPKERLLY